MVHETTKMGDEFLVNNPLVNSNPEGRPKHPFASLVSSLVKLAFSIGVLFTLIAGVAHYRSKTWEDRVDTTGNATLVEGGIPGMPKEYYQRGIGDDLNEYEALSGLVRASYLPMGESLVDFQPDADTIWDVSKGLQGHTWIALVWFCVMLGITVLDFLVSGVLPLFFSYLPGTLSPWFTNLFTYLGPAYMFLKAFESHGATVEFLNDVGLSTDDLTSYVGVGKKILQMAVRGVTCVFREGFFVYVAVISSIYTYITLAAQEGPCDESGVRGRCSVQHVPVSESQIFLISVLAVVSRVASAYNYTDGNWEMALDKIKNENQNEGIIETISDIVDGKKQVDEAAKKVILGTAKHINSTSIQFLAAGLSVCSSAGILILLGCAFGSIGLERRFAYEAIWATMCALESVFLVLNVLVFVLSTTTWIRNLSTLKFYIEGKLWGALYFSAAVLVIYQTSRLAVNMHGTYEIKTPMVVGGNVGVGGEFGRSFVHGKQLSSPEEFCHYFPKKMFEHPEKFPSWNRTLCVANEYGPSTCCKDTEFGGDGMQHEGLWVYTGLLVALIGLVLQVVVLVVTACLHPTGSVATELDKALSKAPGLERLERRAEGMIPRGFKTIQVV